MDPLGSRLPVRAWIPSVVFLLPAMVIGSIHGGRWIACAVITSALLTPLIWPALANRGDPALTREGAIAGARVAFFAQVVPAIAAILWIRAVASHEVVGDLAFGRFLLSLSSSVIAAPIGAALGAVLARNLGRIEMHPAVSR